MRYVSTRGEARPLGFGDALLTGLARDGGLYVPASWPSLGRLERLAAHSYAETAVEVMWPYVAGAIDRAAFEAIVAEAYAAFRHPAVVPLVQLDADEWLLELFHGPTLAFKDVALQLVGRLFDHELARRGERLTIVGATSGDTGSAAIEAVRDRDAVEIFMLHPAGRVSEVQRRQMTTVLSPNVHNLAVEGTFDDCQDLVKAMFADEALRDRLRLSAVNSINWARVMAQVVYYVTAALALGAPSRSVSFAVPTGNFGNVLAGWIAVRTGLPVEQLVVGSNRNDILTRYLATGSMDVATVHPTISPSMDIQVSSNFERLLFELNEHDGAATAAQIRQFRATGHLVTSPEQTAEVRRLFTGARLDDDATRAVIADTYRAAGVLLDPHSAVGLGAARAARPAPWVDGEARPPMVVLATAHPAKFPDAVEQATGVRPALPPHLADLFEREERCVTLPNDLAAVTAYVAGRAAVAR
ncbi:MAG: threonine synthase [Acidimicrobiales bacterium]|nr:threonine synthase [Acidimicrobiales bacterium]